MDGKFNVTRVASARPGVQTACGATVNMEKSAQRYFSLSRRRSSHIHMVSPGPKSRIVYTSRYRVIERIQRGGVVNSLHREGSDVFIGEESEVHSSNGGRNWSCKTSHFAGANSFTSRFSEFAPVKRTSCPVVRVKSREVSKNVETFFCRLPPPSHRRFDHQHAARLFDLRYNSITDQRRAASQTRVRYIFEYPKSLRVSIMTDTTSGGVKRPHPDDDAANSQKRSRSNAGSPLPAGNSNGTQGVDMSKAIAEARAKADAARARLQSLGGETPAKSSPSAAPAAPTESSAQSRIEQMRARVAAATGRSSATAEAQPAQPAPSLAPSPADDKLSKMMRGGLDVGLHPALLGDSGQNGRKNKQAVPPKFATTMANRRTDSPVPPITQDTAQLDLSGPSIEETKSNPYFDPSLGSKTALAKPRYSRQLVFNQKGKYIQQAAALRRQAQLESMKKRIAERARQAGIDEDLDVEKAFLVPTPPDVEWWDEGLINGTDYSAIDDPENLKIDTPDSVITIYVQHPVLLEPPQEKNTSQSKPLFLTSKEQAKMRRQRRMADLKEQQAKIRLGMEPAPPPKVKKSNLMRVLGEEAVKDPTSVEARVNREIAERAEKHTAENEARKLTKEQRHEKLSNKQELDAAKGLHVSVYRVDSLANGRNRFKISKNAEQHALTGICIMHPRFNIVIVEGGEHSINAYKKLMLNRIDWTENSGPNTVREGNRDALASWLAAEDEKTGELKDLSLNTCQLIWEGEQKSRAFRKWVGARVCESDAAAKDALSRAKMENFWTLAKSMKPASA